MATHSSILAWRILWTEEPGGLQPMESPHAPLRLTAVQAAGGGPQALIMAPDTGDVGSRVIEACDVGSICREDVACGTGCRAPMAFKGSPATPVPTR